MNITNNRFDDSWMKSLAAPAATPKKIPDPVSEKADLYSFSLYGLVYAP